MQEIKSHNYSQIHSFSHLFKDFINGSNFISSRFPCNNCIRDFSYMKSRSEIFAHRDALIDIISRSNQNQNLTKLQNLNIRKLQENNSLTVVTGQQVGFLGGPLYTMLKAASAISLANELQARFESINFVPVFWVEDNDHDGPEASKAFSLTESGIVAYDCNDTDQSKNRQTVASHLFDTNIIDIIQRFIDDLPDTTHKTEITELLLKLYQSGKNWHHSFIELLNSFFGEFGLIVVSASAVIGSGVCQPLIIKELSHPGLSQSIIENANSGLSSNGYHIQAKASPVNLFYHENNQRRKIHSAETAEIIIEAQMQPSLFSPNVLLRPIFQDFALPTIAYIAGPGEIGYCSQIKELYDYFGVPQPAFLPRHSATLITRKAARLFERENITPESFFSDLSNLLSSLTNRLVDENISNELDKLRQIIESEFNNLEQMTYNIDATLGPATASAKVKSLQSLDNIGKKIFASFRRKNELILNHYTYCGNLIYPNGSLQERIINPLYFSCLIGLDSFAKLMIDIANLNRNEHHFVSFE